MGSAWLAGILHAARPTDSRVEPRPYLLPEGDASLFDQRQDAGSVIVGREDLTPPFFGHVERNLRHRNVQHLLETQRLRHGLGNAGEEIASAAAPFVFYREERAVAMLFYGVGDPVKSVASAHERHPMMYDDAPPVVGAAGIDALMPGRPLDGQMVVRPYAVSQQVCLPRAVGIVLDGRETEPAVIGFVAGHRYTTVTREMPLGRIPSAGGLIK